MMITTKDTTCIWKVEKTIINLGQYNLPKCHLNKTGLLNIEIKEF